MPLNILVLCHEYPPIGGGAGVACATLTERFVAAGHSATVLTMGFGDLPERDVLHGVPVERLACGRKRREMASPFEALRWAEQCWNRVSSDDTSFDVVHAHFIMPAGIVAARMRRRFGVPFVITAHGSDVPGFNRERLRLAHLAVRPWWRRICRDADCIVSPSSALLSLIERSADDVRSTIIPHAAETRFAPSAKERRVLLCSRLVERKGVHRFLQAIGDLDLPGWEIDIVGTGPLSGRLTQLAAISRTPVRLHGWLDNHDPRLAELYSRAAIFALPSERENFPVSLLEAMSAGCAVLGTRVPGIPEVVGPAGLLVPLHDDAALRAAVLRLTRDDVVRTILAAQGRERVATEFEPDSIAGRYLSCFHRLRAAVTSRRREEVECQS